MVNGEWVSLQTLLTLPVQTVVMFLTLNHQKPEVYKASRSFVAECYRFSKTLPEEEKFGTESQTRRAALSTHLNVAEGCSRKSEAERKRYCEVARGSLVETYAALDIAEDIGYRKDYDAQNSGQAMITCFKILSGVCR